MTKLKPRKGQKALTKKLMKRRRDAAQVEQDFINLGQLPMPKPKAKVQRPKKKKLGKTQVKHVFRLPSGQTYSTPFRLGATTADGAGIGSTTILNAAAAASNLRQLLLDPWSDNAMARWPDLYTMVPTFSAKDVLHQTMQIWNGASAADGASAVYLRGDHLYAYRFAQAIDDEKGTSTGVPYDLDWGHNSGHSNSLNTSLPNGALTRPVGCGYRFTFSGVGVYHTIVARVLELPPYPDQYNAHTPTNFPLTANAGPTFAEREYMRAREVVMQPGDTLNLVCLPSTVQGLNFVYSTYSRDDPNFSVVGGSWSGYVVWFWGLNSADSLYMDGVMHHEFVLPSAATMPSIGSATRVVTKADATQVQKVENTVVDVVSEGFNVFKSTVGVIGSLVSLMTPFLGPSNDMLPQMLSPVPIPSPNRYPKGGPAWMHREETKDTNKDPYIIPPLNAGALPPTAYDYDSVLKGTPMLSIRQLPAAFQSTQIKIPDLKHAGEKDTKDEWLDDVASSASSSSSSSSSASTAKVPPSGGRRL